MTLTNREKILLEALEKLTWHFGKTILYNADHHPVLADDIYRARRTISMMKAECDKTADESAHTPSPPC